MNVKIAVIILGSWIIDIIAVWIGSFKKIIRDNMSDHQNEQVIINDNFKFQMSLKRMNIIAFCLASSAYQAYVNPKYGIIYLVLLSFLFNQIITPISIAFIIDIIKQRGWRKGDNSIFIHKSFIFFGTVISHIYWILIISGTLLWALIEVIVNYIQSIFSFFHTKVPFGEYFSQNWIEDFMIFFVIFLVTYSSTLLTLIRLRTKFRNLNFSGNLLDRFIEDLSQNKA